MINLLPTTKIRELEKEKEVMIILNLGIIFFFFLVLLTLVLFLLKIYLGSLLEVEKIIFEGEQAQLDLKMEKEIEKYNALFPKITFFQKQKISFLPVLEEVLMLIPEKIKLHGFIFEITPKKEILISLSGVAEDRETILGFVKELKEKYTDISFSSQILTRPTNIDFSLKFKIIKK